MLVPPEVFAIEKIGDAESTRYALGGVRFERHAGKPYAIATDGRRMVCVTWDDSNASEFPVINGVNVMPSEGFECLLSIDDCKEAAKLAPKRTPKEILKHVALDEHSVNGKVTYAATDLDRSRVVEAKQVDGKFPMWRQVVPRVELLKLPKSSDADEGTRAMQEATLAQMHREYVEVRLDVKLLKELCDVLMKVVPHAEDNYAVTMQVPVDGNGAVVLKRRNEKLEAEAVLMPLSKE